MVVFICPDCGKDVSLSAKTCPHCGHPDPSGNTARAELKAEQKKKDARVGWAVIIAAFILISTCIGNKKENTSASTPSATTSPTKQTVCTSNQKSSALNVLNVLRKRGERELISSTVYYDWKESWYSMDYQRQLDTIRLVADTEYCASDGVITGMFIEYGGERVAEATPLGGPKVLLSRPPK